jgi:hypothetical protein
MRLGGMGFSSWTTVLQAVYYNNPFRSLSHDKSTETSKFSSPQSDS